MSCAFVCQAQKQRSPLKNESEMDEVVFLEYVGDYLHTEECPQKH